MKYSIEAFSNKSQSVHAVILCSMLVFMTGVSITRGGDAKLETAKIEQLTGLKGSLNAEENVFKVTSPRTDVKISVDQWTMPPFMGLTSWAAFMPDPKDGVMVMGDLVLFQDEVNPVMTAALDSGLSVTALHNHFFFDDPKVYFMHINGQGNVEQLATGVKKALDKAREVRSTHSELPSGFGGPVIPEKSSIKAQDVEDVLGVKGQSKDGMLKIVIGRKAKMACGCVVGKEMGVNTWAAFAGTDDNAVVDGDFAVLEEELQPVLNALRKADINIVAIHHHMVNETPRILFLHYWGKGKSVELAKALKSAIARQKL